MTRPLPPLAARAIMRAAIEDAQSASIKDPMVLVEMATRALTDAGWTITPRTPANARQKPA